MKLWGSKRRVIIIIDNKNKIELKPGVYYTQKALTELLKMSHANIRQHRFSKKIGASIEGSVLFNKAEVKQIQESKNKVGRPKS